MCVVSLVHSSSVNFVYIRKKDGCTSYYCYVLYRVELRGPAEKSVLGINKHAEYKIGHGVEERLFLFENRTVMNTPTQSVCL